MSKRNVEVEQRRWYTYDESQHGRFVRAFDTKHDADLYLDRLIVFNGTTRKILRPKKAVTEERALAAIQTATGYRVKLCQGCLDLHCGDSAFCSKECREEYNARADDSDDEIDDDGIRECPDCGVEHVGFSSGCGCRKR